MAGTPTWRASKMCSRVCGIGPSGADTTRIAPVYTRWCRYFEWTEGARAHAQTHACAAAQIHDFFARYGKMRVITLHLCRARDHVLDIVCVAGAVHVRIVPILCLVLNMCRFNGDATCLFLRRLVPVRVSVLRVHAGTHAPAGSTCPSTRENQLSLSYTQPPLSCTRSACACSLAREGR